MFTFLPNSVPLNKLLGFISIACSLCSASINQSNQNIQPLTTTTTTEPEKVYHVGVFGGSFTEGHGTECNDNGKPCKLCAWPHFLEEMLNKKMKKKNEEDEKDDKIKNIKYQIDNEAISGSSISGSFPILISNLNRIHSIHPYDLIIINYSANHEALIKGTKKNSLSLISMSKEEEVLCGTEAFIRIIKCMKNNPKIIFIEEGNRIIWPHESLSELYAIKIYHSKSIQISNPHVKTLFHQLLANEIFNKWDKLLLNIESKTPKKCFNKINYNENKLTDLNKLAHEPKLWCHRNEQNIEFDIESDIESDIRLKTNQSSSSSLSLSSSSSLTFPSCCPLKTINKGFRYCPKPLFIENGYQLKPLKIKGNQWRVYEDRPGKPGLIIDPTNFNNKTIHEIIFKVQLSNNGIITISYLKSYENMGKVLIWLDTENPKQAKHVTFIDGLWKIPTFNISLMETFTWLPNKMFIHKGKSKGPKYFNFYSAGVYDLHIRLIQAQDMEILYEDGMKIPRDSAGQSGNKFKILGLSSC